MMNFRSKLLILIPVYLLVTVLYGGSASDFDFWIGDWKASWEDAEGNLKSGTNSVSTILDGKIVFEQFDGNPGVPLVGKSWSAYVKQEDVWKQTWVDNNGSYLDFTGGLRDDQMILSREGFVQGKPALQRMRFYNIEKEAFDWAWEVSFDKGETWKLAWKIHYTRLEQADESSP